MGEVFNRKNVYALNKKNPKAIVCPDAINGAQLLTRSDFSSEEEFLFWKEWSDQDYHFRAQGDWREENHTVSMCALSDQAVSIEGPEELLQLYEETKLQEEEAAQRLSLCKEQITAKQFRRVWLCYVKGRTHREIAVIEGVSHQAVTKSIIISRNKLKIFFEKYDLGLTGQNDTIQQLVTTLQANPEILSQLAALLKQV